MTTTTGKAPGSRAEAIKARYARAMALLAENRRPEALAVFGEIHRENPRIAEVEYQIARIFTWHDRFDRALQHARAAVALAPKQPAVWTAWADAVALEGSAEARRAFLNELRSAPLPPADRQALARRFETAAAARPPAGSAPRATVQALEAEVRKGKPAPVVALATRILKDHPDCALAAHEGGVALGALKRMAEAEAWLRKAVATAPGHAAAWLDLGVLLKQLGRTDEAVSALRSAIAQAPDRVEGHLALGLLHLGRFEPKLARPWLTRAIALAPDRQDVMRAYGNLQVALRNHAEAVTVFRRLVRATGRKDAGALLMLAQAESHEGHEDTATAIYDEALRLDPANTDALSAKALHLQRLARFDEARTAFAAAIKADPTNGDLYRMFYTAEKARPDDPLIPEMERQFRAPGLDDRKRLGFGYALAKVHDDLKHHDRVFDYLDPANALMRKLYPYDADAQDRRMDDLFEKMDGLDWHRFQVPDPTDCAPIFVTGMPRSGTTLVEQIIASHSRVTGGGEIGDTSVSAMRLLQPVDGVPPRPVTTVPPEEFSRIGHGYAAMVRERFPGADRITDKSILTYVTMGLMKLAMPQARFIVVRRDPRDTLLSIYKNVFPPGTHLYAYDQVDMARQYNSFVRAVDFWRARVPGWFHEIQYEDLVSDPEPQARALIAACGLDWEDACLNFHENTRKVETLSVWQVRQPISKGSVKAWERYGDRLKPMLDQLRRDGHIKE